MINYVNNQLITVFTYIANSSIKLFTYVTIWLIDWSIYSFIYLFDWLIEKSIDYRKKQINQLNNSNPSTNNKIYRSTQKQHGYEYEPINR